MIFDDLNKFVIICKHILEKKRSINLVMYHTDGDIQFICGQEDHYSSEDGHAICLHHILDDYPDINQLHNLPKGWGAEKDIVSSTWIRRKFD